MEKSKLPIKFQRRTPIVPTNETRSHVNVAVRRQEDTNVKFKRAQVRRSKSFSDLRSVTTASRMEIARSEINLANKPVSCSSKTAIKRPAPSKPEAKSAPKILKPNKIPPYDYKARYNLQVEKNSTLKANLKELEAQLCETSDIKLLYTDLLEKYDALQNTFDQKVQYVNLLEEKCTSQQLELQHTTLELSQLRMSNEKLNEQLMLLQKKFISLESAHEKVTKKSNDLVMQQSQLLKTNREQEISIDNFKINVQHLEDLRRVMHNKIQDLKGNIRVFCRVRPELSFEIGKSVCHICYIDENTLEIRRPREIINTIGGKSTGNPLEFVFDKVFPPDSTQVEVFEELSQLIQSAIDGYNVCVFAYGQTGSGKTYTMQGDQDHMGMIPRSIDLIFDLVEKYEQIGWRYSVKVSFLEIYNETIRDLLDLNCKENLEIRYNEGRGTTVTNLTTKSVQSSKQLHYLMQQANQNRMVAVTNYNEHSSRSHAVTKITLVASNIQANTVYVGSLNLVDLAGSESVKTSQRIEETKNINKSLSALGTVMMALQNKDSHVPYRNSKLTYLLQSSLGGNSKTMMFVNIASLEEFYNESVNALRFASKVKEIKTISKKIKQTLKKEGEA